MSDEEWRSIPGYEDYYEVSSWGRVWSVTRVVTRADGASCFHQGRMLKLSHAHPKGYVQVNLYRVGRRSTFYVHTLVLVSFFGPAPLGMEARHLDGDPGNNFLDNLTWGTPLENAADQIAHGRGYRHNLSKERTRCPRRHLLSEPNLVRSGKGRDCLACARARARMFYARTRHGVMLDLQQESDRYYESIMKVEAS